MQIQFSIAQRDLRARIIFGWLALVLIYFFYAHSMLSQLASPVLIFPSSDNVFWFIHLLRIPQFLLSNYWVAMCFDLILFTSVLGSCIFPRKTWLNWIAVVGIWVYYYTYSTAAGKHYAQIGYFITPVAFLAASANKFNLLWNAVRYWVCFLYTCAGIYKIYYGGFGFDENMSNILMQMNGEWLLLHPHDLRSSCIQWLIQHPGIAQQFFRSVVLIDFVLIIGFFTKKFDHWLLVGLLLFHIGNYFLLHISFIEQSLIFAPLLPWHRIDKYFQTDNRHD
jgi:hypothetical protein